MTLWDLLLAICFFTTVAVSYSAASQARVGLGGHALALVIGSAIGACAVWVLFQLAAIVAPRVAKLSSKSKQEWLLSILYLFAILWILLTASLASPATTALMRTALYC